MDCNLERYIYFEAFNLSDFGASPKCDAFKFHCITWWIQFERTLLYVELVRTGTWWHNCLRQPNLILGGLSCLQLILFYL